MKLTIKQERFEQAMRTIQIRNEFYVNEVQPALSRYSLIGHPVPIEEFEEKLGERLFLGSILGANTMYKHITDSEESLHNMHIELEKFSRELFPNEKFLTIKGT
uniref:Uncharacterized protein n=1 Tax=Candidatus Kentrum sp. SD TaxID=2126332 RepID=A0A450YP79_9GAMM|nr:MAG: hypothetical protein BECKSD772F_GA0070984_101617 [Candidatus Kentron sp. SD]VFK43343.1 MAG: hypothetical protein BECKSD772E_GA0070983_102429 [Candidatus Kentron sp. SD]